MSAITKLEPNRELLITKAAAALIEAKASETQARKHRIDAEQALVDLIGKPDEGSKTERATIFKVTVKQPVNRKIDQDQARIISAGLGKRSPFKSEMKLDLKKYKVLREADAEAYNFAAQAITATPGKVSVAVEEITEAA